MKDGSVWAWVGCVIVLVFFLGAALLVAYNYTNNIGAVGAIVAGSIIMLVLTKFWDKLCTLSPNMNDYKIFNSRGKLKYFVSDEVHVHYPNRPGQNRDGRYVIVPRPDSSHNEYWLNGIGMMKMHGSKDKIRRSTRCGLDGKDFKEACNGVDFEKMYKQGNYISFFVAKDHKETRNLVLFDAQNDVEYNLIKKQDMSEFHLIND